MKTKKYLAITAPFPAGGVLKMISLHYASWEPSNRYYC